MYRIKATTQNRVMIASENQTLIFLRCHFRNAQKRKKGSPPIRNPVEIEIDKKCYIFKKNEWKKALAAGKDWRKFHKPIGKVYREEMLDKAMLSKKLSKSRTSRLIMNETAKMYS